MIPPNVSPRLPDVSSTMLRLALLLTLLPSIACFRGAIGEPKDGKLGEGEDAGPNQGDPDAGPNPPGPATLLRSSPSGVQVVPTAEFAFECEGGGCTFSCRVDDEAPAPCESPHQVQPVAPGEHVFEVRAERDGVSGEPFRKPWTVRFPYTLVGGEGPLAIARDPLGDMAEYALLDLRCARVDMGWQGQEVYDTVRPDPFQCRIDYWFGPADGSEVPTYEDGRGQIKSFIYDARDYQLRARVYPAAMDPAPWPEGTFLEVVRTASRDAPDGGVPDDGTQDAGTPDAGQDGEPPPPPGAADGVLVLGSGAFGSTCPTDSIVMLSGEPTNYSYFIVNMFAFAPPEAGQTSSCAIRVPVTVASGWNVSDGFVALSGDVSGGPELRLNVELAGETLFDARVDPRSFDPIPMKVSLINWEACPKQEELTIRLDFENVAESETETVAIYLDSLQLSLVAQGGFGWQTCDE